MVNYCEGVHFTDSDTGERHQSHYFFNTVLDNKEDSLSKIYKNHENYTWSDYVDDNITLLVPFFCLAALVLVVFVA